MLKPYLVKGIAPPNLPQKPFPTFSATANENARQNDLLTSQQGRLLTSCVFLKAV